MRLPVNELYPPHALIMILALHAILSNDGIVCRSEEDQLIEVSTNDYICQCPGDMVTYFIRSVLLLEDREELLFGRGVLFTVQVVNT